jgi:hypothetical protein
MHLPRAERPEQLGDFITLAPTHVVNIVRISLDLFAQQKVEQVEKSLKRLVVSPPRIRAVRGAAASYVLD